ncbi:hypothetical protein [Sphingomonas sp. PAMC 26621]|uniref:hypothetical protein n=1 Tax=Sphingomonas sp. PAMC 26621 TaxID=1112213 RepID=UPI003FD4C257
MSENPAAHAAILLVENAITAATQRYEDASDQLQRKFDKHLITDAQYRTGLTKITQARDAETAAASKSNATHAASDRAAISRAERLGREADAIGAQTRNLYLLADAYGVSGAAALMAEARVKAESQAIKQQGDIQAAISREIGLVVAQRVSDAAKATASMRDQAAVQEQLNAEVAAGNVPAERAQAMLRDRMPARHWMASAVPWVWISEISASPSSASISSMPARRVNSGSSCCSAHRAIPSSCGASRRTRTTQTRWRSLASEASRSETSPRSAHLGSVARSRLARRRWPSSRAPRQCGYNSGPVWRRSANPSPREITAAYSKP